MTPLSTAHNTEQSFEGEKKEKKKENSNTIFQEIVSLQKVFLGVSVSVKPGRIKVILLKYFLI